MDNAGIPEILFAMRMYPSITERSPHKNTRARNQKQFKNWSNPKQSASQTLEFQLNETEFESRIDSTLLVSERARRNNLERTFNKQKGVILEKSNHTITFLPDRNRSL